MKVTNLLRQRFEKIQVPVKYKRSIYKINAKDGMFIIRHQLWLLLRRLLRFLKRLALRSVDSIIVLMCAVLFGIKLVPIGLFIEDYNNWYDVLWDMRTFF